MKKEMALLRKRMFTSMVFSVVIALIGGCGIGLTIGFKICQVKHTHSHTITVKK